MGMRRFEDSSYGRLCADAAAAGRTPGRLLADRINALGTDGAAARCGVKRSNLTRLMMLAGVRYVNLRIGPDDEWDIVPGHSHTAPQ